MANHDQTTTATIEGIYSFGTTNLKTILLKVDNVVDEDSRDASPNLN